MRLIPLVAALSILAAPALAQETPAPAEAPTPAAAIGVAPAAVSDWLKSIGAIVGETQQNAGRRYIPVYDGRLDWMLWFYTCGAELCDDIQYSSIFTGGQITQEKVNDWNRDNRFIKAFYIAPVGDVPARAVAQFDVLLTTSGVAQINDVTATWANQLDKFANAMGFAAPAPAATPAPAQ